MGLEFTQEMSHQVKGEHRSWMASADAHEAGGLRLREPLLSLLAILAALLRDTHIHTVSLNQG